MALPDRRAAPAAGLALALAFASGAGLATQAYINGRLSGSLGSPELAAAVNNTVGLLLLLALGLGTGALGRGLTRARTAGSTRWWHFLGGPAGAFLIYISARAAPQVGVALLTVALVCGLTVGSLAVDSAGLSPAGRRSANAARLGGVGLAIGAVLISAAGSRGDLDVALLALVVAAGVGIAVQQAANGQLAETSGEPLAAGTVNFAIGGGLLVLLALVSTGGDAPGGWSAPAPQWVGGALGVAAVVTAAWAVGSLGVLAEYVGERVERRIRPQRLTRHHPELSKLAEPVGDQVARLRETSESLLRRHGKRITEQQLQQKRLADAVADILAQVAVISRVSSAFERDGVEASSQERYMAETFCTRAASRVDAAFDRIESNDDDRTLAVAQMTYKRGAYPYSLFGD